MFTTHLEAMEELSGNVGWGMLSAFSIGLVTVYWYLPESTIYIYLEPQYLQMLPRRHL